MQAATITPVRESPALSAALYDNVALLNADGWELRKPARRRRLKDRGIE
jgi:hypothetical protein